jgi:hypothetical protein
MVTAGCDTETDTADQPVPPSEVAPNAPAPAPEPAAPSEPDDVATDTPPAPDAPRTVIPAAYRGEWDRDAAACAKSSGDMGLSVSASRIQFYEGSSRILAVRDVAGGIEVDTEHSAEGTTDRRTYRLSTSGNELTVTINGHAATRVRCAA